MIICVACGKLVSPLKARGSYKHPYCVECFKKVWHNDNEAYISWLNTYHIPGLT